MRGGSPGTLFLALALALALACAGCGAATIARPDPLLEARRHAADSSDGAELGRWLLLELVAPGGLASQAHEARKRLDERAAKDRSLYAVLGRALDDEAHGALQSAAPRYLEVIDAARAHPGPESEMVAWFASSRLLRMRPSVAGIWATARPIVERAIAEPGRIGFRARGDLVDWWMFDTRREGKLEQSAVAAEAMKKLGCLRQARLAGPFGDVAPLDLVTHFAPERPGPWPVTFPPEPGRAQRRLEAPRVLEPADLSSCSIRSAEPVAPGVHYVEAFFETETADQAVIAVQGAWSVVLDDVEVLARDPRVFGIWPRFAVAVALAPGRHRLVARIGAPDTSIRVLDRSGRPLPLRESRDTSAPYTLVPPRPLPDPNPLAPFLGALRVPEVPPWPRRPADREVDVDDPVLRFIGAELAHVDGQEDVASVLFEPLVQRDAHATGLALATQAGFVDEDPVFAPSDARNLALDLRRRAIEKDPRLWFARLWLLVDAAQKSGPKDQLAPLAELARAFPEAPAIGKALAQLYAHLGYKPEHQRTLFDLVARFPDDPEILRALLAVQDESGRHAEADETVRRIAVLEPTSAIEVERAILRADYAAAVRLLERDLATKTGDAHEETKRRILDLLVRAGRRKETLADLEKALAADPSRVAGALRLADARLAGGDHGALRTALADAIRQGLEAGELRDAIEVVDGMSELEVYRLDPFAAIKEYQASGAAQPAGGPKKGGTAARVLDYAAIRIHPDGSARMLEHEILHMQSREAIAEHAEQKLPRAKLLRVRTIKADGRTFEPEVVQGKPTVTMPHLDVGDFIETETLYDLPQAAPGGRAFVSPRWFFREAKVDYHRSEFVVVSPRGRDLTVETTGSAPPPTITEDGASVVRRWRVERSPALPEEPLSADIDEFLPSVRVGWGVSQTERLERLRDALTSTVPPDPRLERIARTIATSGANLEEQEAELRKVGQEERAKRIYRWVLDNVEPSRESDPRRVVLGKSGNRAEAFVYLARLAGVPTRYALIQDRLTPAAVGPFAEAELFSQLALVVPGAKGDLWMVVGDKYAPFGYLPSSLRGQPAVVLDASLARTTTSTGGPPDGVTHQGEVKLAADGSAVVDLEQRYTGRPAIELRTAIQSLPADQLEAAVEAKLVAQAIPGGRVLSMKVEGLLDLDAPLVLKLQIEASTFARRQGAELLLAPPLAVSLGPLAQLDKRETPLVIRQQLALRVSVNLRVALPKGAEVTAPPAARGAHGGRSFETRDRVEGGVLVLDRTLDLPAGRVVPADYGEFVAFVRASDEALHRVFPIRLP